MIFFVWDAVHHIDGDLLEHCQSVPFDVREFCHDYVADFIFDVMFKAFEHHL
jgi:hypothetical protein